MYPADAKSGRSKEQAASTDVIPAAVPSTVFSGKIRKLYIHMMQQKTLIKTINKENTYCQFYSTSKHHTCTQPLMPKQKIKNQLLSTTEISNH